MSNTLGFDYAMDMKSIIDQLKEGEYETAFIQSANKTAKDSLVEMAGAVTDKWNINVTETSSNVWKVQSVADGTSNQRGGKMTFIPPLTTGPEATINIQFKGYPINLSRFVTSWNTGIKKNKRQVAPTVRIERGGQAMTVRKSFTATMYSGHRGVFQRERVGATNKILELRTITLPSMLHQVDFGKVLDRRWQGFGKLFDLNMGDK